MRLSCMTFDWYTENFSWPKDPWFSGKDYGIFFSQSNEIRWAISQVILKPIWARNKFKLENCYFWTFSRGENFFYFDFKRKKIWALDLIWFLGGKKSSIFKRTSEKNSEIEYFLFSFQKKLNFLKKKILQTKNRSQFSILRNFPNKKYPIFNKEKRSWVVSIFLFFFGGVFIDQQFFESKIFFDQFSKKKIFLLIFENVKRKKKIWNFFLFSHNKIIFKHIY